MLNYILYFISSKLFDILSCDGYSDIPMTLVGQNRAAVYRINVWLQSTPSNPKTPTTFKSYCPVYYPRKSDHYVISNSWCPSIECIYQGLHGDWFIHLHALSHTDGQDFGSSHAHCLGQITAESSLSSEFKQGHLCLTVKSAGDLIWLWTKKHQAHCFW